MTIKIISNRNKKTQKKRSKYHIIDKDNKHRNNNNIIIIRIIIVIITVTIMVILANGRIALLTTSGHKCRVKMMVPPERNGSDAESNRNRDISSC